ncbi:hypothetical protein EDB92DRAFT_485207 [Lactarius akahatsu]|uniref:Uncharacterized protein n=1 Tax=Lactarius akahatsu TaxID=416441 RepID=A0AAD4QHM8_9AGAM|nr:hypothetical protein EDB92DRAFT_485207 [Lactarius akahatsu]
MDDLWGNAWGSPDNVKDERKPVAWSTSEKPRSDDPQEDDLSMPSWSTTGPGIRWDEPSATLSPLWSTGHHDTQQDWSRDNPYGNIPLGNSSQAELPNDDSSNNLESHPTPPTAQSDDDDMPASPPSAEPELEEEVISPQVLSSIPTPEPSPPPSPNAFGTFIAGAEQGDVVPNPSDRGSLGGQLYADEWGSPWGSMSGVVEDESLQHTDDEWESAKLRQLEMDRRVPPELLSRILLHLEDFAKDAWPGIPDEAEADWQRQWHSGLDFDGLDALMPRYVPSLTLPQVPPFGKSFTAKAMADAVKLSRNTALARTSPMSTFLAAKGSTAWETSVKSRIETSVDEVPLGWRILEKEGKKDEKIEEVRKPTGLLAGLWGRRTSSTTSSIPGTEKSTPSPSSMASESVHSVQTPNQRSSLESVKSPSGTKPVSQTLLELSPSLAPAHSQDGDSPPSSAPSAVSRFLNRFSRSRQSSSHSRNSLTLSGDDLEYLSDVRSNSTDPMDASGDEQLDFGSTAPSSFLGKLPPLLPPPLSSPPSSLSNATTSLPPSLGPLVRDDTKNGPITTSLVDLNASLDARKPVEQSSIFALTPLIPGPIRATSSKSIHPISDYSIASPSDKINPPFSATLLPTSSRSAVQRSDVPHNDDDDDFSDFLSSPADPPLLTFSASPPSSTQVRVPPPHTQSMSSDDDFANLMSLSTGALPDSSIRPDVAITPNPADPAFRVAPTNPTSLIAQRRKGSRTEEHLHTLGLLELAAARPGRWPAPPSPLPEVLTPPPPPESAPSSSADLNILDTGPAPARSNHQRQPSSPRSKETVQKGHQRTQSLLDLAASRPGRWPAPPSPFHEALLPPPPPARDQGGVVLNVDYFGTTPTEESFTLPPPPPPPGKTSPPPSLSNIISPQMTLGRSSSPFTGVVDVIQSSSPPPRPSAPLTGPLSRRALSPPPLPTAVIGRVPPKLSSTPIPLLPPPSGYRLTPPLNPPPRQYSPESTPLALLVNSDKEKNAKLPVETATPPPPVKGTGGLTAQDLSFFEGL